MSLASPSISHFRQFRPIHLLTSYSVDNKDKKGWLSRLQPYVPRNEVVTILAIHAALRHIVKQYITLSQVAQTEEFIQQLYSIERECVQFQQQFVPSPLREQSTFRNEMKSVYRLYMEQYVFHYVPFVLCLRWLVYAGQSSECMQAICSAILLYMCTFHAISPRILHREIWSIIATSLSIGYLFYQPLTTSISTVFQAALYEDTYVVASVGLYALSCMKWVYTRMDNSILSNCFWWVIMFVATILFTIYAHTGISFAMIEQFMNSSMIAKVVTIEQLCTQFSQYYEVWTQHTQWVEIVTQFRYYQILLFVQLVLVSVDFFAKCLRPFYLFMRYIYEGYNKCCYLRDVSQEVEEIHEMLAFLETPISELR